MEITPDVVKRAWRDEAFRAELPADVRDALPAAPDGVREMDDEQLAAAAGGAGGNTTPFAPTLPQMTAEPVDAAALPPTNAA